jgi:restriction system protein
MSTRGQHTQPLLVTADTMSFAEWFQLATAPRRGRKCVVADYQFPSDVVRSTYLATIGARPEHEVRQLLYLFLLPGGGLGADRLTATSLILGGHLAHAFEEIDFVRRLISPALQTWPSNTWVLDLLPDHPRLALQALDAYLTAHIQFLPDGRLDGLCDAKAVIRARYLEKANPRDTLLALSPQDFECLIGELFRRMGYDAVLTPTSHDGGCDVHARRTQKGQAEHLWIECKRYDGNVGVRTVRALLGVVAASNATKGVLVTTGEFTSSALLFEQVSAQIDLVGFQALNRLLNEWFGSEWPTRVDFPISLFKRSQNRRPERRSIDDSARTP